MTSPTRISLTGFFLSAIGAALILWWVMNYA